MINHDQTHKDLFKAVLPDFIILFFPELAARIDLGSMAFKEQSFGAIEEGAQNIVDVLVSFDLLDLVCGKQVLLFHLENMAHSQASFGGRMKRYYMKIRLSNPDAIIFPVVLFTHDSPRPEETVIAEDALGLETLRFQFHAIQLRNLDWRDTQYMLNPAATALIANMGRKSEDRVERKLTCYRQIDEHLVGGLPTDKIEQILRYVDTYLDLDDEETLQFEEGFRILGLEKKPIMTYLSASEKKGLEQGRAEGLEKGLEKGLEEGRLSMIELMLDEQEIRLGESDRKRLEGLSAAQQQNAMLQLIRSPETFTTWLADVSPKPES